MVCAACTYDVKFDNLQRASNGESTADESGTLSTSNLKSFRTGG